MKPAMERMLKLENGYNIWTKTVGSGPGLPLLLLHGGPGAGHDYLEPLGVLGSERPVIFYDQLGCGKSDKPNRNGLWTIERFADEVQEVRDQLGLNHCHILGQSWGGWLGVEYLLRQPKGLASFVLASTSASIPEFRENCNRLIAEMPDEQCQALQYFGARGEFEHPDYVVAKDMFYARHLRRLKDLPDCVRRTAANIDGNAVYHTINGPNEFTTIGNLRYWDRTADLGQINTPCLITCGRYDELGPTCAATLQAGIPNSETVIFEDSAHSSHIEEPETYAKCVSEFLARHDA